MGLPELLAVAMMIALCVVLMAGYPVALTLGGVALGFAFLGHWSGVMDLALLGALPARVFGVMANEVLIAIPLFVFMGVMLERHRIAGDQQNAQRDHHRDRQQFGKPHQRSSSASVSAARIASEAPCSSISAANAGISVLSTNTNGRPLASRERSRIAHDRPT